MRNSTVSNPELSIRFSLCYLHTVVSMEANRFACALTQLISVADPPTADMTGGIPAIFIGYYPGSSNRTAVDIHQWTWFIPKAHSCNNTGTVALTSRRPRDVPQIKFRSYTVGGDEDLQVMYESTQLACKMNAAAQPAASYWNITRTDELPGPEIQIEAEIKEWIVQETWGRHASCTVLIGADDDKATMVLGPSESTAFSKII
jgi:choline dehydrogenase